MPTLKIVTRDRASAGVALFLASFPWFSPFIEADCMATTTEGVAAGGFGTRGQMDGTNAVRIRARRAAMQNGRELASSHSPGAPLVNDARKCVGLGSEFDLLGAVESGQE